MDYVGYNNFVFIVPNIKECNKNKKIKKSFMIIMILISEIIYVINITILNKNNLLISEIIPQILRLWTWITYYYMGMYISEFKFNKKFKLKNVIILCICMIIYEILIGKLLLNDLRAENF